jgi:hypothetical protein
VPTFKIESFAEAKLASLTNRTEKHGKDEVFAFSAGLVMVVANTDLDQINPEIRDSLYKPKDPAQGELPEVGGGTPVLRCNSFGAVPIPAMKLTGWMLQVDDGAEGTEPLEFGGCKVDKFTVDAQQGGSVILRFRVGTSDIDADRLGKLGMHLGQSIWITLTPPAPAIDGSAEGGGPGFGEPDEDATSLFAGSEEPTDD